MSVAEDYKISQHIYDKNLIGISAFEIQCIQSGNDVVSADLFYGEFSEMTEGLMTLSIITKKSSEALFSIGNKLLISYSKYGESFYIDAVIIESSLSGFGKSLISSWKYTVQMILCTQPIRHRRKYVRVSVEWTVNLYFDNGNTFSAKTIDVSEGGFKGIIDKPFENDSIIKCSVDVGFGEISSGDLTGKVIHCYPFEYDSNKYEITVQFIAMDAAVREFLGWWIEKIQPAPINSEAVIYISETGLVASIQLLPPENNGEDMTYDALCRFLDNEGIKHGVDYDLLKSISEKPQYNLKYIIAQATLPKHGKDAVLTFHVEMNPTFAPKVNEEGIVDFKDLGQIRKVNRLDVLAERIPPTLGETGISVTGTPLDAIPGDDKLFPAGTNTYINDTNTALIASCDGYICIADGNINVFETYVVDGDVQYTTGNIDHNGIVIIKGDVRQGFSVTAAGDVLVSGTIESATVKAGGSLVVSGGCVGENNNLEVGGDASVMFIDGGDFKILGNLKTSYILNSKILCGDCVDMVNSGLIRNSHVIAKNAIHAKTIGGAHAAADNTVIEVGSDPKLINDYNQTCLELDKLNRDIESAKANVRGLTVLKHKNELTPKMLTTLEHYKKVTEELTINLESLESKRTQLKKQIDELGFGYVTVSDIAYEGFKVIIGFREMFLTDSVKAAKFRRKDDNIVIVPLDE